MAVKASKYGDVNSYSYNKEVINRLKKQGKISSTKASLFKLLAATGVALDKTIFKHILDIGFIKDTQNALFSTIAVKVKGDQNNLLGVQYANKVGGNQYQLGRIFGVGGIQLAGKVGGNQEQLIGLIQVADEVGGNQIQLGWIKELFGQIQYANKVGGNQYQLGGTQLAGKIGGNQGQLGGIQLAEKIKGGQYNIYGGIQFTYKAKKQQNSIGIQYGKNIKEQLNGVGFQYGGDVSGEQLTIIGGQYAKKTKDQTIGMGIQGGKVSGKKKNWLKEIIKDILSKNKQS